jgi:hypothetical integral membrane protein (TIGR02206 family)
MFKLFSLEHFVVIILAVILSILVIFVKSKFWSKILFFGLIFHQIYFYIWHFYFQTYEINRHLPLHLCTLSIYISAFALFSDNKFLKDFQLLWSFPAAILAILLPDLNKSFPTFQFVEFFISHILIFLTSIYFLFVQKVCVNYKNVLKSIVLMIFLSTLIFFVNLFLNSNYLFLINQPGSVKGFFPSSPFYQLLLAFIAIFTIHIEYLFYAQKNSNQK